MAKKSKTHQLGEALEVLGFVLETEAENLVNSHPDISVCDMTKQTVSEGENLTLDVFLRAVGLYLREIGKELK